eukprot:1368313-Amorphochlora_amoeboformis.AAC.1
MERSGMVQENSSKEIAGLKEVRRTQKTCFITTWEGLQQDRHVALIKSHAVIEKIPCVFEMTKPQEIEHLEDIRQKERHGHSHGVDVRKEIDDNNDNSIRDKVGRDGVESYPGVKGSYHAPFDTKA